MQYTIEQAPNLGGVIRAARNVRKWRRDDAPVPGPADD